MASNFPQSLAFLIAFWVNGLLHGIYLVLFLRWLLTKQKSSIYFVAVCWIGFVAANIDFGVNLYLLVQGFWFWLPKGGPDAFFANLGNWQTVFREVNYQVLVSVCDAFMVYRLWRVWNSNWYIIILPSLLLICETVFGLMAPACLALGNFKLLATAINVFLGFNTALQVVLTVFIGFRLLDPRQMKLLPSTQRARRFQLVRCIVESGLIVTVALVLDLALFVQDVLFHWVFNISLTQLYAITTVLIVLRMNPTNNNDPVPHHSSHGMSKISSQIGSHVDYPISPRSGIAQSKPVAVSLYNGPSGGKMPRTQPATPRYDLPDDDIEMKSYDAQVNGRRSPQGISVHVVREVYNQD